MTALNQYSKLEATAIWRVSDDAQRRDVFVSLGEATLVIHDGKDVALTHWSLPAIVRQNPNRMPAIYAPGDDTTETLEIADETMVTAVEKVRNAVSRGRPRQGRLRLGLIATTLIIAIVLATVWMPGALVRQTAAIVPEASRSAIGETLLEELRPLTGAACRTRAGDLALARLRNRLLPDSDFRLIVMPSGLAGATHLPGGTILIGRAAVEDYETPEVVAGYILAEAAEYGQSDPIEDILEDAGITTTLSLLTSGDISSDTLQAHAKTLVAEADNSVPAELPALAALFTEAQIPTKPFAYALDVTGETVLPLIEADAVAASDRRPILEDGDWVALQNICGV